MHYSGKYLTIHAFFHRIRPNYGTFIPFSLDIHFIRNNNIAVPRTHIGFTLVILNFDIDVNYLVGGKNYYEPEVN